MTEDRESFRRRLREKAEQIREEALKGAERIRTDPEQVQEWLRQNSLILAV